MIKETGNFQTATGILPGRARTLSVVLPTVVIHDQRDRQFPNSHCYSTRSRA